MKRKTFPLPSPNKLRLLIVVSIVALAMSVSWDDLGGKRAIAYDVSDVSAFGTN